jgi:hypothetical protein
MPRKKNEAAFDYQRLAKLKSDVRKRIKESADMAELAGLPESCGQLLYVHGSYTQYLFAPVIERRIDEISKKLATGEQLAKLGNIGAKFLFEESKRLFEALASEFYFGAEVGCYAMRGRETTEARKAGGKVAAQERKAAASVRDDKLRTEALKLLKTCPTMSFSGLARIIAERNGGSWKTISRKLPALLAKAD